MENILLQQNPHWTGQPYKGLLSRSLLPALIDKLTLKEIQILLGIRRSGKSTLFKLLINELLSQEVNPKQILYINLDDPFYQTIWQDARQLYSLIELSEKLTGYKPVWLFLDEVQNVTDWEKFVKSQYDAEQFKKIFITGSNSSLLQGSYAKLLTGRYLQNIVYPLSYSELLSHHHILSYMDLVTHKAKILNIVDELLYYGGFPEVHKTRETRHKREIILSYYESILFKDCVANHSIRDVNTFQTLSTYILTNNAALYSYNTLAKNIESNENTIKEFLHILEDSFLIKQIYHFSYSLKKQIANKKKSFSIDNGLLTALSPGFSENKGRLLENLVYTELKKSGYEKIYYYLQDNKECDFIAQKGEMLIPIQVTWNIDEHNEKREIAGLESAMQLLNSSTGYIVTYNQEIAISDNIHVIPFHKFFFSENIL